METDKTTLFTLTKEYYKTWENRDPEKLKLMFSEDIVLIDPIILINSLETFSSTKISTLG